MTNPGSRMCAPPRNTGLPITGGARFEGESNTRLPVARASSFSGEWLVLDSGPSAAPFNMALDEAVLESVSLLKVPVLRFYGWTEPAASFGYFQRYSEVAAATQLRPLVRRPTGGGIVPHDADWTYSLSIPPLNPWYETRAVESYRRMHEWLQSAFAILELPTALAPCANRAGPGQCFVGYEQFDLLWHGRKVAGAAQRRTRNGLLIQGSVQSPVSSLERNSWQQAMIQALANAGATWRSWKPDGTVLNRARDLSAGKYALASYNQKR